MTMEFNELLHRLQRLKKQIGGEACSGCGIEHNCGTDGCRILREAEDLLPSLLDAVQRSAGACEHCVRGNIVVDGCELDCDICTLDCVCRDCRDGSRFELKLKGECQW